MKSSKIFGSIALSAALAMGTAVPAFAVETQDADEDQRLQDESVVTASSQMDIAYSNKDGVAALSADSSDPQSGSSTVVEVQTYTSQISVTIPLKISVALDTVGGKGYAPADGEYAITNNSEVAIDVVSASYTIAKDAKADWTFGTEAMLSTSKQDALQYEGVEGKKKVDKDPAIGSMVITITPQDEDLTPLKLVGDENDTTATQGAEDVALGWMVEADDGVTKDINVLPTDIAAGSSILKQSNMPLTEAASITYTVAVHQDAASA